jgi:hypothetical protein
MNNILFEKTGVKLTEAQIAILKKLFWGVIAAGMIALGMLAVAYVTHVITLDCAQTIVENYAQGSHNSSCINQNYIVPAYVQGIVAVLFVIAFVPFIVSGARYLSSLASNRDFREKEMAASVDYMEEDEREQLVTMRATRRAYMVLNFTLLVFWLMSLVTGHFSTAVTLFVVQLLGSLSYRRSIR